jgi:hypothetical protein
MAEKIYYGMELFGDQDSPVTITGHSLRLNFKQTADAFQAVDVQKYQHKDPKRYIGRIRVSNLDTNTDYYEECDPGCSFTFFYNNDDGSIGTLTVDRQNAKITIQWDGITFQQGGPTFVNDTGALQQNIVITNAASQQHNVQIDNPANCQIVLFLKH